MFQDELNGKNADDGQSHDDSSDAEEDEKSFFDKVSDFFSRPGPSWESRPEYYDPDRLMGTSMAELHQQVAARRAVKEAEETRHIEGAFAGEYANQFETPDFSRFDAVGTEPSLSPSLEIPDISAPADTNWNAVRESEVFSEKDTITDAMASPVSMESSDAHLNQSRPNDLLNIGYDASGNFGVGNFWDADNTYTLENHDPASPQSPQGMEFGEFFTDPTLSHTTEPEPHPYGLIQAPKGTVDQLFDSGYTRIEQFLDPDPWGPGQRVENFMDIVDVATVALGLRADKIGAKALSEFGPKIVSNSVVDNARVGASANKLDPYHRFSDIIDNYAGDASRFDIPTKGPGGKVIRTSELRQIEGSLNGKSGVFEWIVDQGNVTHRRFITDGKVTGFPNQVSKK